MRAKNVEYLNQVTIREGLLEKGYELVGTDGPTSWNMTYAYRKEFEDHAEFISVLVYIHSSEIPCRIHRYVRPKEAEIEWFHNGCPWFKGCEDEYNSQGQFLPGYSDSLDEAIPSACNSAKGYVRGYRRDREFKRKMDIAKNLAEHGIAPGKKPLVLKFSP